jgi:uncharacterized membrane protein YbhN (UPF0104 family)
MTIKARRLILAALTSILLLGVLLLFAKVRLPDLSRAQPEWLLAVLLAHVVMVSVRGLALRALAPRRERTGILKWINLAARHQLIFSVVPGGVGDLGFPYFAKRIAALDLHDAVRIIAQFRMRDLIFVALMGASGLVLIGLPHRYALFAIALALPILWFSDDLTVAILRLGTKLAPRSRFIDFLRDAADHAPPTISERMTRTLLAVIIWTASTSAVLCVFRAIGAPIGVAEALVFIAAVNFAGAISLSIAGLGPSEAGAAAALVAAGRSVQRASSLALIVRPLLLISVVCSSLALDLALSLMTSRKTLMGASTP